MSQINQQAPRARYDWLALAAALLTCAVILVIHRESLSTLISAHGLLHTAIASEFAGGWSSFGRPENPFFAGELLPYYWFYHYVAAQLARMAGLHPLQSFELLGLLAVCVIWFAGARLGRSLGWRPTASLAIGLLAFAGANALGPVILLAKLASGKAWPVDDGAYLWGLAHPVMGMARFNDPGGLYGPMFNFFLNNSSRGLGLAGVMAAMWALRSFLASGRLPALAGVVIASAACTVFAPVIGLAAGVALSAALALEALLAMSGPARDVPVQRFVVAIAALVTGCVLVLPTFSYLLFHRAGQASVVISLRTDLIGTLVVSAGPLLVLALIAVWRIPQQRQFLRMLVVASVLLMGGNTLIRAEAGNDSNLFHVAAFLIAVPAAGAFQILAVRRSWRNRLVASLLVLLCVSTASVVAFAYWKRPPILLALTGDQLHVTPSTSARARLYEWISGTPARAVFVVDSSALGPPAIGNTPDFPAVARRVLFVAADPPYIVNPNVDRPRRQQMAAHVIAGQPLSPADRDYLGALHRPIFVIVQDAVQPQLDALAASFGPPVFSEPGTAVFAVYGQ